MAFGSSVDDPLNFITVYYDVRARYDRIWRSQRSYGIRRWHSGKSRRRAAAGRFDHRHVTDAKTHLPLAGIDVAASEEQGLSAGAFAISNGSGDYTLAGVLSGPTYVSFRSPSESGVLYSQQIYNGETFPAMLSSLEALLALATPIPVTVSNTTSGIDAAMVREEPSIRLPPSSLELPRWGIRCPVQPVPGRHRTTHLHLRVVARRTPITGATSAIYVAQEADLGHVLLCEVTATNKIGSVLAPSNTVTVPAALTAVIPVIPPLIVVPPVPAITVSASKIVVSSGEADRRAKAMLRSIELTEQVLAKAEQAGEREKKRSFSARAPIRLPRRSGTIAVRLTAKGKNALARRRVTSSQPRS